MTSEEVPEWVRSNYKEQYGKDYAFKGGGFVLVDRSDRLMILNGDDITDKGAIFSTTKRGKGNSVKTCRLPIPTGSISSKPSIRTRCWPSIPCPLPTREKIS
ncbi:hypothetical protein ACPJHQ_21180 [Rossellomorea sp. H39__3]